MTKSEIAAVLEEIGTLLELKGENPFKIRAYANAARSIEELLNACQSGRVAKLPGFGETTQEKICKAIEERAKHSGYFQFGEIAQEAETLKSDLAGHPDSLQVDVAGSYRRRKEIVHDVDLVVATKNPEPIMKFFVAHPLVESLS